jgi:hypothetical protein
LAPATSPPAVCDLDVSGIACNQGAEYTFNDKEGDTKLSTFSLAKAGPQLEVIKDALAINKYVPLFLRHAQLSDSSQGHEASSCPMVSCTLWRERLTGDFSTLLQPAWMKDSKKMGGGDITSKFYDICK